MKPALEYEYLIRELFLLKASGKTDSPEAQEIRDRLFVLGGKVSEKVYLRGIELGKKLYFLQKNSK